MRNVELMFTRPPDIADSDVIDSLWVGWGFDAATADYVPLGFGSHHWTAAFGDSRWFVTIDNLAAKRRQRAESLDQVHGRLASALRTALVLRAAGGLEFVIAPMPCLADDVTFRMTERYAVSLYPHVDGESHPYGAYRNTPERLAVLDRLVDVHRAPHTCRASAQTDDFAIANRDALLLALDAISTPWDAGPFAEPARELLRQHADAVASALERYDALADHVREHPERLVLTHGEPHPANTITTERGLVLIDWDTALIAPPERDLWDLVGQDPGIADDYRDRTGTAVDPSGIDMYRLAWDLAEIAIYIGEFRGEHTATEDSMMSLNNLRHFLDPTRWTAPG